MIEKIKEKITGLFETLKMRLTTRTLVLATGGKGGVSLEHALWVIILIIIAVAIYIIIDTFVKGDFSEAFVRKINQIMEGTQT